VEDMPFLSKLPFQVPLGQVPSAKAKCELKK